MLKSRWAACPWIAVLFLVSCGGGGAPQAEPPATGLPLAAMADADRVLAIPFLQSGTETYAEVRLELRVDGSFAVLSPGVQVASVQLPHAELAPAVAPAALASAAGPIVLRLKRVHFGRFAYASATIEIAGGRWRHLTNAPRATALSSHDFEHNPQLTALSGDLLVLRSEPGRGHAIPLLLHGEMLRYCIDAHEEGIDHLTLRDGDGRIVAQTRPGQPCMEVDRLKGLHRLEHAYGGSGAARTLFLRGTEEEGIRAAQVQPPAALRTVLADAAPSVPDEFVAIRVIFRRPDVPYDEHSFMSAYTTLDDGLFLYPCWAATRRRIGGFVSDRVTIPTLPWMMQQATSLFDSANFFRFLYDANGNPTGLGGNPGCQEGAVWQVDPQTMAATLAPAGTFADAVVPDTFTQLFFYADYTHSRRFFGLHASSTRAPIMFGREKAPTSLFSNDPPLTVFTATPRYRTEGYEMALRYRPGGTGTLYPGQVALYNSGNCSGPAMVMSTMQLNLTGGGPMGDFTGSLRLGPQTTLTVSNWLQDSVTTPPADGQSRTLIEPGCLQRALTSLPFAAVSLRTSTSYPSRVAGQWQCRNCNLANIDVRGANLAGYDLSGSNLTGARLDSANLAGANLQDTILQGTQLPQANLDGANLCNASLDAPLGDAANITAAANLSGAYLRNANLTNANLSGANLSFAGFFSEEHDGACAGVATNACAWTATAHCASAFGTNLDNATFAGAYLAGTDFRNARGNPDFGGAILVGAAFNGATFQPDNNGRAASFAGAYLMGADFSSATLTRVVSTGAFTQVASGSWDFILDARWTGFRGFTQQSGPRSCAAPPAADGPVSTCQSPEWNSVGALPPGMASNPPVNTAVSGSVLCDFPGGNQCYQRSVSNLSWPNQ